MPAQAAPGTIAILDDLQRLGLVSAHPGGLRWSGPESGDILCALVGLRDGAARSLTSVPLGDDSPIIIQAVPDGHVDGQPHLTRWGGAAGSGFSRRAATVSCLFEVAERCAQMRSGEEAIATGSFNDLKDEALHPNALLLEASEGGPNPPFDPDAPIAWAAALNLATGARRWLPASYCFRSGEPESGAWNCPSDSTGCASGTSTNDVIARGTREAIERDAVAIWWHNRIRRPACAADITELDSIRSIALWQKRLGRSLTLLDLTTDLQLPVVAAVSHDEDGRGIAVGFGAHFDPADAAIRACLEMAQFQTMIRLSLRLRGLGLVPSPSPATTAAWAWFEHVSIADEPYLRADPSVAPTAALSPPQTEDARQHCIAVMERHGLELLYLDLTRSWIGVPTGRVIVPGLRSTKPRFGPGRLYDVPEKLNWLARPHNSTEMNQHAFVF